MKTLVIILLALMALLWTGVSLFLAWTWFWVPEVRERLSSNGFDFFLAGLTVFATLSIATALLAWQHTKSDKANIPTPKTRTFALALLIGLQSLPVLKIIATLIFDSRFFTWQSWLLPFVFAILMGSLSYKLFYRPPITSQAALFD